MAFRRLLIIGNSGSGKSWLAARLGALLNVAPTDCDAICWIGPGRTRKRDAADAIAMVERIAQGDRWIIEGVYGWLAEVALPRATCLVWLDLPVADCIANLRERGLRGGGDRALFNTLLEWARDYEGRSGSSSRAAHRELVKSSDGGSATLRDREAIEDFLRINESDEPDGWVVPSGRKLLR